ncbi:cytochrome c oxidase assembly factor 1 homolog [Apostichopus japonicus]|uniref:cytochrome c oxidase assembly factor 1 homolog n=1 Tax=Stichopus japonicus TaxID=307972 RepID=UPI003AB38C5A
MPLPLKTLRSIAVITGFATLGGATFFYKKIQDNLISGTYYSTSLMLLKEHEYAKELLGHPIKTKFIDLGDQFNVIDGEKGVAQLAIPLRGKKQNGTLYTWSTRTGPGADWTVEKVELQLKGSPRVETIYPKEKTQMNAEQGDSR